MQSNRIRIDLALLTIQHRIETRPVEQVEHARKLMQPTLLLLLRQVTREPPVSPTDLIITFSEGSRRWSTCPTYLPFSTVLTA